MIRFFLWVYILSVFFCVFSSLYRKLRTAVQTAEAHCAFVFDPNGFSVSYFNSIFGAFFGTHSAVGAGVFNRKTACAPQSFIVFIEVIGKRYAAVIEISAFLFVNLFYDFFGRFISFFVPFRNLIFIRQIVNRSPCVGHSDGILCVDFHALIRKHSLYDFACAARKAAVGCNGENIVFVHFDIHFINKTAECNRQTEIVYGKNEADIFVLIGNEII